MSDNTSRLDNGLSERLLHLNLRSEFILDRLSFQMLYKLQNSFSLSAYECVHVPVRLSLLFLFLLGPWTQAPDADPG